MCLALEDHPNKEFCDKALPFLPTDICAAFMLHKQSSVVGQHHFSNTLCQGMDGKWHSPVTISALKNPVNLVTIQDSSNCDSLNASQVPNCVLMDSNQGDKDPSQDFKCSELDCHLHGLSPTTNWGYTTNFLLPSARPDPDSTLTAGNISQSICFCNGSNKNNSPPRNMTQGNEPSFPSVTNDISSIPGNTNHNSSSKSSPSRHISHVNPCGHDVAATNFPVQCNDPDDAVSSIGNQL